MANTPITELARKAANRQIKPKQEQAAVVASTDPMLRNIEVQSGMAPDANVLKANLYTGANQANADQAYFEALTKALPNYINAYRDYKAAQAKTSSSGSGSTTMPQMTPTYSTFPSTMTYVPGVGFRGDVTRNTLYAQSPYGSMPIGELVPGYGYPSLPKPPTRPTSTPMTSAQKRLLARIMGGS